MAEDGDIVLFKQHKKRKTHTAPVATQPAKQKQKVDVAPSVADVPREKAIAADAAEQAGPGPGSSCGAAETFKALGLSDWLCSVCKSLGMARPTQVQSGCIPAVLNGKDVIGLAQTGSGKTAAFALPILQKLAKDPYGVFAVVLTPTRCAWYMHACMACSMHSVPQSHSTPRMHTELQAPSVAHLQIVCSVLKAYA